VLVKVDVIDSGDGTITKRGFNYLNKDVVDDFDAAVDEIYAGINGEIMRANAMYAKNPSKTNLANQILWTQRSVQFGFNESYNQKWCLS